MIGVDEVGRGCWAGPLLVVAARSKVKLPQDLKDSKLLSAKRRNELVEVLRPVCEFGEGWVTAVEIDAQGLAAGLRLGAQRACQALGVDADDYIVVDGSVNYLSDYKNAKAIVKADQSVPIVSAASIWAKVHRDEYMHTLSQEYAGYGFDRHAGYGTAAHQAALESFGYIAGVHRLSFKPVAKYTRT